MTIWRPHLRPGSGPLYRALADLLAADIAQRRLEAGTRLPTHRALATQLGVTVGTVSRAYAEVARLGLIRGEVGRGSFVRDDHTEAPRYAIAEDERDGIIDLSANFPSSQIAESALRDALAALAARPHLADLLEYQHPAGGLRHRAAGAVWLAQSGLETRAEQVVVTSGAQHALMVAFSTLAKPGDLILCSELTYPGMISLARLLRLRLAGLSLDDDGLRPDAFEAACRGGPRALFCMPTVHNPTAVVMSEARRRELAAIARRHDVTLVEDDSYGFLPSERPPPLASFLPEQSYFIAGLAKCVAPGLRVGYLRTPGAAAGAAAARLHTMMFMAPPLMLEIASRWIEDETVRGLVAERRREAARRQARATSRLSGLSLLTHPESYHLWLRLPEPWRADEFAAQARGRGVLVTPAEVFAVGRSSAPHAVRLCLAAARSDDDLERGLDVVAELARSGPGPTAAVI